MDHFMHFHKAIVDGNPILVWKQISIGHVDMLCYLLIRATQFRLNKKKIYLSIEKNLNMIFWSPPSSLINNMCTSTVGCCPTGAEFLGGYSSHPEAAQQRPPSWQLVSDFFFPPSARHSPVLIIKINFNFHQVKVSPGTVMITAFNQLNEFIKKVKWGLMLRSIQVELNFHLNFNLIWR